MTANGMRPVSSGSGTASGASTPSLKRKLSDSEGSSASTGAAMAAGFFGTAKRKKMEVRKYAVDPVTGKQTPRNEAARRAEEEARSRPQPDIMKLAQVYRRRHAEYNQRARTTTAMGKAAPPLMLRELKKDWAELEAMKKKIWGTEGGKA